MPTDPAPEQRAVLDRRARGLVDTETEAAFTDRLRRTDLIFECNQTPPSRPGRRAKLMRAMLGSVGERAVLLLPFHAGYGSNVHFGDDFFGNVNLTCVDDVEIRIGHGAMIAPTVTLTTTGHPVHPDRRADFARFSEPIVIEDRVWTGSDVTVLPGCCRGADRVRVGDRGGQRGQPGRAADGGWRRVCRAGCGGTSPRPT